MSNETSTSNCGLNVAWQQNAGVSLRLMHLLKQCRRESIVVTNKHLNNVI